MQNFNKHVLQWSGILAIAVNTLIIVALVRGEPKAAQELDWLDVLGEGGAALFVFAWFWFFLSSRPVGLVTRYLAGGLAIISLALLQDVLDEFIRFPPAFLWNTVLQSSLLPLGMTLLTVGIYLLRKEQQVIAKQLSGRESILRDYRLVDDLTRICDSRYLYHHLHAQTRERHLFSLVLLDVNNFNEVNRRFGYPEGDRLLGGLAELLLLNMRNDDLLCRYAGDRFAILLSGTGETEALTIAEQLKQCIASYSFYTNLSERVVVRVATGTATCRNGNIQMLLDEATINLLRSKELCQRMTKAA